MKQRTITAVIALLIFIPIIILGGVWVSSAAVGLGLLAMAEIFIMKKKLLISPEALITFVGVTAIIIPKAFLGFLPAAWSPSFSFYVVVMLLLLTTVFFPKISLTLMMPGYIR